LTAPGAGGSVLAASPVARPFFRRNLKCETTSEPPRIPLTRGGLFTGVILDVFDRNDHILRDFDANVRRSALDDLHKPRLNLYSIRHNLPFVKADIDILITNT
jgi:hypothetical protein